MRETDADASEQALNAFNERRRKQPLDQFSVMASDEAERIADALDDGIRVARDRLRFAKLTMRERMHTNDQIERMESAKALVCKLPWYDGTRWAHQSARPTAAGEAT